MLTAGLTFGMLTGCGGEEKKTYDQACADLAQGSYDYAHIVGPESQIFILEIIRMPLTA